MRMRVNDHKFILNGYLQTGDPSNTVLSDCALKPTHASTGGSREESKNTKYKQEGIDYEIFN
jgi:hypothetical protein